MRGVVEAPGVSESRCPSMQALGCRSLARRNRLVHAAVVAQGEFAVCEQAEALFEREREPPRRCANHADQPSGHQSPVSAPVPRTRSAERPFGRPSVVIRRILRYALPAKARFATGKSQVRFAAESATMTTRHVRPLAQGNPHSVSLRSARFLARPFGTLRRARAKGVQRGAGTPRETSTASPSRRQGTDFRLPPPAIRGRR